MSGTLLVFAGSLAGVAFLILVSRALGLGRDARISGESEARELANNAVCDFEAREIALDRQGHGALLENSDGRLMLIAPHGAHFVARLLERPIRARREGSRLTVAGIALDLGEAAGPWEKRLARLDS